MRRFSIYLAAASLALSPLAFLQHSAIAAAPSALAKDNREASDKDAAAARELAGNALDHAVAGDLQSLLKECVGSTDRDRIEKNMKKADETKYKDEADKFRDKWKKKYGSDFNAASHSGFAKPFAVDRGKDDTRADLKIEGSGVKEPVYLHMHKEKLGQWVIALPDSVTGDNFADSMLDAVTQLANDNDWPNSVDEGYRHAAGHMLKPLNYSKK